MLPSHITNDAIAIAAVVIAIAPHDNPNARKRAMRKRAKMQLAKGAAGRENMEASARALQVQEGWHDWRGDMEGQDERN